MLLCGSNILDKNLVTNIAFSLKAEQQVNISIYNIRGQRVKTLVNDILPRGPHTVVWNGEDTNGRSTATGIYFVRMQTVGYEKAKIIDN